MVQERKKNKKTPKNGLLRLEQSVFRCRKNDLSEISAVCAVNYGGDERIVRHTERGLRATAEIPDKHAHKQLRAEIFSASGGKYGIYDEAAAVRRNADRAHKRRDVSLRLTGFGLFYGDN